MPKYTLGAFIYPEYSSWPARDAKPIMATVTAPSLHLAHRMLIEDLLSHGFYSKDPRLLTDQLYPFDEEEWEIAS
jgi:hypothetical protein